MHREISKTKNCVTLRRSRDFFSPLGHPAAFRSVEYVDLGVDRRERGLGKRLAIHVPAVRRHERHGRHEGKRGGGGGGGRAGGGERRGGGGGGGGIVG